jgi:hypothetical protein
MTLAGIQMPAQAQAPTVCTALDSGAPDRRQNHAGMTRRALPLKLITTAHLTLQSVWLCQIPIAYLVLYDSIFQYLLRQSQRKK